MKDRMREIKGYFVIKWNDEDPEVYPNVVVNDGLKHIGDILVGADSTYLELTHFGVGTGSTNVSYTDTELEGEIGKISPQVTSYPRRNGNTIENSWLAGTSDLNGSWHNIGVFFGNNSMFAHANVTGREKTSSDQLQVWYFIDLIN